MSENKRAFLGTRHLAGLLELADLIANCGYELCCTSETVSLLGGSGLELAQVESVEACDFELVICDLFDFQNLMNQDEPMTEEQARAKMDLAHQAIILAAASNYQQTAIICDGGDYRRLKDHLKHLGETTIAFRKYLAAKAFLRIAEHNFAISAYINLLGGNPGQQQKLPL